MEEIRKKLCSLLAGMPDKNDVENFMRVFFNRVQKGNTALMLGVTDKKLIRDTLLTSADEIINDDAGYLVRICRTRQGEDKVVFSFLAQTSGYKAETCDRIKALFLRFSSEEFNSDDAISKGVIPPLVVKGSITDLLKNWTNEIAILSGEKVIDSVSIWTSNKRDCSIVSSIDEFLIIPCKYNLLVENSVVNSETDGCSQSFWKDFSIREKRNCHFFNFVILNNVNDHLIRVFNELISLYIEKYSIKESFGNILKRVFFICNKSFLDNSRVGENTVNSNYVELADLSQDIEVVSSSIRDAELYNCLLLKTNHSTQLDLYRKMEDCIRNTEQQLSQQLDVVYKKLSSMGQTLSHFPNEYNELKSQYEALMRESPHKNREAFFESFDSLISLLIPFCEKYAENVLPNVLRMQDCFSKDKREPFLKKHFLNGGKKEFMEFIAPLLERLRILFFDEDNKLKSLYDQLMTDEKYNDRDAFLKSLISFNDEYSMDMFPSILLQKAMSQDAKRVPFLKNYKVKEKAFKGYISPSLQQLKKLWNGSIVNNLSLNARYEIADSRELLERFAEKNKESTSAAFDWSTGLERRGRVEDITCPFISGLNQLLKQFESPSLEVLTSGDLKSSLNDFISRWKDDNEKMISNIFSISSVSNRINQITAEYKIRDFLIEEINTSISNQQ